MTAFKNQYERIVKSAHEVIALEPRGSVRAKCQEMIETYTKKINDIKRKRGPDRRARKRRAIAKAKSQLQAAQDALAEREAADDDATILGDDEVPPTEIDFADVHERMLDFFQSTDRDEAENGMASGIITEMTFAVDIPVQPSSAEAREQLASSRPKYHPKAAGYRIHHGYPPSQTTIDVDDDSTVDDTTIDEAPTIDVPIRPTASPTIYDPIRRVIRTLPSTPTWTPTPYTIDLPTMPDETPVNTPPPTPRSSLQTPATPTFPNVSTPPGTPTPTD